MHTHTHLLTAPQPPAFREKNLPQEALSKVKLLLALKPQGKCQVSPKQPSPTVGMAGRAHSTDTEWESGAGGEGPLRPPTAMCGAPGPHHLGASVSAPNSSLRAPPAVPRDPCPPRWPPHLLGPKPVPAARRRAPHHRAGCPRPFPPPPAHPANSPLQRPGHGAPCRPQAPRPPLRLPR